MAVIDGMEEREQKDFDARLNAPERGPQRPSQGVEQLWGLMGRPAVPRGGAAAAAAAAGGGAPARPRPATKVGGGE